ncbi:DUF6489 family protein [Halomonas vilamensis]|uniref:DUF6489 family protein n=1 Tax=Vreelandella vilamensis TaxID=531309 RepID=A0ABU1H6J6_9GAMM|nr:DUF6489 family protein [Halomonas vilamensis]MDR5899496.1 DUF6489 family protein [Halomonas vilamensis]
MKINVEFDLTPDEFRRAMGLPDVEAFQQNLLGNIQRQMESGVEGYDPMSLMKPYMQQPMMQQGLSQGLANFGTYQQMMMDMLKQAGNASYSTGSSKESAEESDTSTSSQTNSNTSSGREASSSSSSDSKSHSRRDDSNNGDGSSGSKAKAASASSRTKRTES